MVFFFFFAQARPASVPARARCPSDHLMSQVWAPIPTCLRSRVVFSRKIFPFNGPKDPYKEGLSGPYVWALLEGVPFCFDKGTPFGAQPNGRVIFGLLERSFFPYKKGPFPLSRVLEKAIFLLSREVFFTSPKGLLLPWGYFGGGYLAIREGVFFDPFCLWRGLFCLSGKRRVSFVLVLGHLGLKKGDRPTKMKPLASLVSSRPQGSKSCKYLGPGRGFLSKKPPV